MFNGRTLEKNLQLFMDVSFSFIVEYLIYLRFSADYLFNVIWSHGNQYQELSLSVILYIYSIKNVIGQTLEHLIIWWLQLRT